MSQLPRRPSEELSLEDAQRFMYACSHERRSPTTQRMIDGTSYGWIHLFIRHNSEDAPPQPPGSGWLDPGDADPTKLAEYFGRVASRLREEETVRYARSLEEYFHAVAGEREMPWPHR